ncbi:glycosyltransferase family 2 protein [Tunicatimonas pelagia]|uniref:glycosyltransferase family 2 protein n=1 Tax=Tunicatimonas pelagia TaxID=931531 RepID=UPI002665493E|nr:glycosyltransferase family 2 protein [Tunicatimonas pelagia]WKN41949.1 glycosyltransferase family 2 protein [Tunicatimonas pelagia]
MTAVQLSVTIITYNEEKNIERCINSVKELADEVLVVDSYSTDKTKEICQGLGIRFIEHTFEGHIQQKNYALDQAEHEYILALDADEALTPELFRSIQQVKQHCNYDAYRFNRLTSYCGKWIKHCGWYPDTKLRLWNRQKGRWGGENPHDSVKMIAGSSTHHLNGDLLHYSFPSVEDHARTANRFSEIASDEAIRKDRRVNILVHVILNPLFTFVKKYFFQLGFLDGYYGFVVCVLSGYSNFLKYSKIYSKRRKASSLLT